MDDRLPSPAAPAEEQPRPQRRGVPVRRTLQLVALAAVAGLLAWLDATGHIVSHFAGPVSSAQLEDGIRIAKARR